MRWKRDLVRRPRERGGQLCAKIGASTLQSVTSKEAGASAMKGRIAFIPAAHKIDFHEYDVPAPPAGGVVAEVTQTNVCGSEVHIWRGEFGGRDSPKPRPGVGGRGQGHG